MDVFIDIIKTEITQIFELDFIPRIGDTIKLLDAEDNINTYKVIDSIHNFIHGANKHSVRLIVA